MLEQVQAENPVPKSLASCRRTRSRHRQAELSSRRSSRIPECLAVTILLVLTLAGLSFQGEMLSDAGPSIGDTQLARISADSNTTLTAIAGPDQIVQQGQRFQLDGGASTGNITNYTWTFVYGGQNRTIPGKFANLSLAEVGVFNFTLNVTRGKGNYSTDVVQVTVTKKPFNLLASYWQEMVILAVFVAVVLFFYLAVTGRISSLPEATQEKMKLFLKRWRKITFEVLRNPMGLAGVLILIFFIGMAAFGPYLAPYKVDLAAVSPFKGLLKPSPAHWLGTDELQQDIFSELLYGARTSIIVGVVSAIIASVLGALVGLYSGYAGGWKDEVIMRANDVVLSIPWLVLMIVVAAMLRTIDLTGIILIIGLTGWSTTARMVRAQVLSLKERQFVERAKAIGASDMAIIRRHILPNAFPLVFANTILTVAISILSEATLSFLNLRPVNTVTWGTMLSYAHDADAFGIGMQGWIILPGVCIVSVVLGFTLLGYALDDIMNPKLRKR